MKFTIEKIGGGFRKPAGMSQSSFDRYVEDGFSNEEISQIWKDTIEMRKLFKTVYGKEKRDITTATYERAQKRLNNQINDRFKGR